MDKKSKIALVGALASVFGLVSCGPTTPAPSGGSSGNGSGSGSSNTYCEENYPSSTSTAGNVYVFDATPPSCIGVEQSIALKKSINLSVGLVDIDASLATPPQFSYESNLKITLRKSGLNPMGYDLYGTLNFTNSSAIDYCYDSDNIELRDSNGALINLSTNFSDERAGALINTSNNTRRRCLLAGQTHVFIAEALGVSEDTFNNIASAAIPEIELDELRNSYTVAADISAEMEWLNPGNGSLGIPTLSVTWTNTSTETIRIDDHAQKVWFMDSNGYILSESYIYLDQHLNVDESDLMPDDYLIVAGGTITLEDTDADNAYSGLSPSSATRALVYLDWEQN